MKNTLFACALCMMFLLSAAQKRIVVMGSSTSAGTGSSSPDSSWVGRFQKYYRQNTVDGLDTVVINIAWYGQTTYSQMPTGWVSPVANRPAVDPDHNVTKALSYAPDAVIINLPSNDVANFYWGPGTYDMKETMDNFRYMANVLTGSGVNTFFTTTQPRNDMDFTKRQMQRQLYDSIYNNFGQKVIDFWNPIVTTDGQYMIRPELKYDDIHVNDWGHRLLFQQAAAKNLFSGATTTQAAPGPGRIEAESYSGMQGVQTEGTSDAGGGLDVGYIDNGDWIEYRLNPPTPGTYTFNFRVASGQSGAQFQVRNTAGSVLATVSVPATGGWQAWQTVSAALSLPAGTQTLRLVSVAPAGWNLNWLEYKEGGTTPPPPSTSTGGRIEAESYTTMQGVQTEGTSDVGGGLNVGYIDYNDWMDYAVNPPASGVYTVNFRVASQQGGGQLQLRSSAGAVLATVNVPNTGGWQSWQTVPATVTLSGGQQTLRIVSTAGANWNLNWWEIVQGSTTTTTPTGRIEAEAFSTMSGVQTENTADAGGGQNVGYIDNGDWMDYSVTVGTGGAYTVSFRMATQQSGAQFQVRNAAGSVLATVAVPNTGGWQTWQTIPATVNLVGGAQTIRLVSTATANWNINWMEIGSGASTPSTTALKIEAESYSTMTGVQTENTADAGGGQNVGYIDNGDWMDYNVNIPSPGTYTVNFRVASTQSGGQFQLRKSDGTVLATVAVPNTGGWQTWQTVPATVTLSGGQQTLRIVSTTAANWNLNWWEVVSSASALTLGVKNNSGAVIDATIASLSVYPNPVVDKLVLQVNNNLIGALKAQLYDMNGTLQKEFSLTKSATGAVQFYLSIGTLPAGTYVLRATMTGWSDSTQVVKQ